MTLDDIRNDEILKDSDMNDVLTSIKESMTEDNLNEIIEILKLPRISRYIQYLISKQVTNEEIGDSDYQNLYLIVYILQTIYNQAEDESPVSDYDYDRLYELMRSYGTEIITTPILSETHVVNHRYRTLRGTLAKIYILSDDDTAANENRGTLANWVKRSEDRIYEATGKRINFWDEEIYVFPKWDGVSVIFEFDENNNLQRALTRGDTETNEAQDVTFIFTPIVSRIRDENMIGKAYGLKTEVMVREEDLEMYNKRFHKSYKSTRSIVNSIINSDTLDGRENLLEVVRLRTSTLDENGIESLQQLATNAFERPYIRCRVRDVEAIRNFAYKHTRIDGLNTDGAVLYIIDEDIRNILGRKNHKNQYEIAFKFNDDIAYTKLKKVKFTVTPFGRVFPTAEFESVKMKGNTVSEVSLGSIARFNELKLHKGDVVKIMYEIIPYLDIDDMDPKCVRSNAPLIEAPTHCPECGELLEMNSKKTILYCINPKCTCRKRGKILNYIKKIGMKNIGDSTVNDLYEYDLVKTIPDLYELKDNVNKLVQLPGYDVTSVNTIVTEIEKRRYDIPVAVFMGSIGIECIGRKTFEKVFKLYTLEDLMEFAEDCRISKLVVVPGIKDLQAKKILDGIDENKKIIKKLLKDHITISYPDDKKADFIAVFHKIRSTLITQMINEKGGTVDDNLTKSTTFLIVPNGFGDSHSSTSDKARKYGIPIVEIDDVESFIESMKEGESD